MIAGAGGQVTTFMGNGEGGSIDGAGATVLSAEEARAIFAAIDTEKSGEITIDELRAYMRREDPSVTEEQVQRRYVYLICIEPRNLALVPHLNDPASHQSGRLLVLEKENKGLLRDVDALLWAKENLAVCLMYPSLHLCVYVCASLHQQQFFAHAGKHSDVHTHTQPRIIRV
jgi:hypothetical protein